MPLIVDYNKKIGEATFVRSGGGETEEVTYDLYRGNAFLVFIYEYRDKDGETVRDLHNFFADEAHAKIMFGLKPDYKGEKNNHMNTPSYCLKRITIDATRYDYAKKLISILCDADFDHIEIVLNNERSAA